MQEALKLQQVIVSEEIQIELENTIPKDIKDFIRQQYGQKADLMMYSYKTDKNCMHTIGRLYRERKPMIDKLTELRQSKDSIEESVEELKQS